ncbi:MAG TPA: response regulator [Stellaceae bacterium]|jgi:DNA-binding NarL/FixJ family response regulator
MGSERKLRLLLVGDCAPLLEAVLLQKSDLHVAVEKVALPADVIAIFRRGDSLADFDAVVVDPAFREADAFDGISALRQALPSMPIIVVTDSLPRRRIMEARQHGAAGFITTKLRAAALMKAIRLAIISAKPPVFRLP